jgi:hypothetical protein
MQGKFKQIVPNINRSLRGGRVPALDRLTFANLSGGIMRPIDDAGEDGPMAKVAKLNVATEILRDAIRAKICEGVSRRTISLLVLAYASSGSGRDDGTGVWRMPVEEIADSRRFEFLAELCQLQGEDLPVVAGSTVASTPDGSI